MKKIIKLTEEDLQKIVKKVIKEQSEPPIFKGSDMQANLVVGKDGKTYINFQSEMGNKYPLWGPIKNTNLPKGTFMISNKNGQLYYKNIRIEKL